MKGTTALDRGLWITWYGLPEGERDAYLAWLHKKFMPRMLKKPGVLWAAHYASEAEREKDRTVGQAWGSLEPKNEPLRLRSEGEFVSWVTKKVGSSPEAYRKIKAVNLGLLQVWEMEAQELETGKNECALG